MNCNLKILNINVRSLRANFVKFKVYLNQLNTKFDILVLTEVWVKKFELINFNIDGYQAHIEERKNTSAGGVICYVREDLPVNVVGTSGESFNALHIKVPSLDLNVLGIYKFCKIPESVFLGELDDLLCMMQGTVVLTGDLNIDILERGPSNINYLNLLETQGYECLVTEPTRYFGNLRSCIDHVFFRGRYSPGQISTEVNCSVDNPNVSDHWAVLIDVIMGTVRKDHSETRKFIRYSKLRGKIRGTDWEIDRSSGNVDMAFMQFIEKLQGLVEESKAVITNKRSVQKTRKPWASPKLVQLTSEKARLYRLVKKHRDDHSILDRYKDASRAVVKQSRLESREYHSQLIESYGKDAKKYWSYIKSVKGVSEKKVRSIQLGDRVLEVESDAAEIADEFGNYYDGAVESLSKKFEGENIPDTYSRVTVVNSFAVYDITPSETFRHIMNLPSKPSTGPDGLPARVFRESADVLAEPLTDLFNFSLKGGIFPEVLKKSLVVPVYKSGCDRSLDSYRPISLLSVVSKIFEKIVKERMLKFLDKFSFFADKQFGFLPRRSVEDALFRKISEIATQLERGKSVAVVYVDLCKAFDTVDFEILLRKLFNAGFRGPIYGWLRSYLTEREQMVKVGSGCGKKRKVRWGVPQGSVLGPLLFLIYINELFSLDVCGTIYAYADDVAIVYYANAVFSLVKKINAGLKELSKWLAVHRLTPNLKKTNVMAFGLRNVPKIKGMCFLHSEVSCSENCRCEPLEQVYQAKYLGIIFDSKLIWGEHSEFLQAKLRKLNYLLFYLAGFFTEYHLRKIYYALYDSVLKYGLLAWGGAAKQHIQPLMVLQKWAIRNIVGLQRRDTTKGVFERLGILDIEKAYTLAASSYVQKNKASFNVGLVNRGGLRARDNIARVPNWAVERLRRQAPYRCPVLYNSVSREVRKKSQAKTFRKHLKVELLQVDVAN